jgi:hypothetical protein
MTAGSASRWTEVPKGDCSGDKLEVQSVLMVLMVLLSMQRVPIEPWLTMLRSSPFLLTQISGRPR